MENTYYANGSANATGYWLETPYSTMNYIVWEVTGFNNKASQASANTTGSFGVRPVIEVLKTNIEY